MGLPPRGKTVTRRRVTVFVVFTFAYFLSQFFRHANAVISDQVADELALGAAAMGLMTSLFYGMFAAAQLPLGAGLDRYGARVVTPAVMMAALLGSLVFGSADSFAGLAAGRALLGLGMSGVLMGSYVAFSQWFPVGRFATMSGLLVGIGALGGLGAASPLAWFSEIYGWRSVFFFGAGAVAIAAGAIFLLGGDPPAADGGAGADAGAGTRSGPSPGGLSDVFSAGTFWRIAPLNLFFGGGMLAVQSLWAGPFLYDVAGFSTGQTGRFLALLSVGAVLGFMVCGWLADRLGLIRMVLASASAFMLCEAGLVASAFRPATAVLAVLYFLFGLTGAFQILLLVQVRSFFPAALRGRAVTAVNLFGIGGAAFLQWSMGLMIGFYAQDAQGRYPAAAYAVAFGFLLTGTLLAFAWYLPISARLRPHSSATSSAD